ncbi:zinc finger protein 510-like isoform X2 [Cydia pomonella]|uniref:zinc finger protein 510-like isoform X2 n=1 Tax=Cydia pomonella TaxID=82600 RepID=UPI002ADDB670|nr:zinc finger protein 510-like isoform X2 [Cydia pomonella]
MDVINSCRCCLQGRPYKDMVTPYTHLGKTEIYSVMLKDCFDLHLTLDANISRGICLMCVSRLRDASDFKLLVQRSQTELQEALLVKDEDNLVKSEPPDDEMMADLSETDVERPPFEFAMASSSREKSYTREECKGFKNEPVLERLSGETHLLSGTCYDSTVTQENNNSDPCGSKIDKIEKKKHGVENLTRKANLKRREVQTLLYCNHCSYTSPCKSRILRHQTIHTVTTLFNCNHCSYTSTIKGRMLRHQRIHTDEKPYMCDSCAYQCTSKKYLQSHMMIHTGEKPFSCSICDYKGRRKSELRLHEMTHSGEKPYQCSQCDYKCNIKSHLQRHEGTHPGMKNKSHKCTHCDYQTIDKSHLNRHLKIHTGEMPFKCDLCDYQCRRKAHLNFHQMKHTGEKPHKCSYCDFRCARKSDLPAHQRTHTGEKPYKCNHCSYASRQKHVLVGHIKSKHCGEQREVLQV